jgi:hypothetical protein
VFCWPFSAWPSGPVRSRRGAGDTDCVARSTRWTRCMTALRGWHQADGRLRRFRATSIAARRRQFRRRPGHPPAVAGLPLKRRAGLSGHRRDNLRHPTHAVRPDCLAHPVTPAPTPTQR